MKKAFVFLFVLLYAGQVWGQATKAWPAAPGTAVAGNAVVYHLPRTVLTVEITVRHETVRRGPYARYAQQFLGAVAHLSDKEIYTILGASLSASAEADPSATYVLENPDKTPFDLYYATPEGFVANDGTAVHGPPEHRRADRPQTPAEGFDGLTADKWSTAGTGLEEAAAEAARTLFTLRKRRFDLVTGEAGENVYGAGLPAALDEMKRLEEEYTALFLGKRTMRTVTRRFEVVPEAGKNTLIVCRFTEAVGLLPADDLTGRPIVLELTPEQKAQSLVLPRPGGRDARGMIYMRVADRVKCRLIDDKTVLFSERVPVYQFGEITEVPVTSVK